MYNLDNFNIINSALFEADPYLTGCKDSGNFTKYAKLSAKILYLVDNRKHTCHPFHAIISDALAEDRKSSLPEDVVLAKKIGKELEEANAWK